MYTLTRLELPTILSQRKNKHDAMNTIFVSLETVSLRWASHHVRAICIREKTVHIMQPQ
jgi:hypothetical protein